MSIHNICFHEEIRKKYCLDTHSSGAVGNKKTRRGFETEKENTYQNILKKGTNKQRGAAVEAQP